MPEDPIDPAALAELEGSAKEYGANFAPGVPAQTEMKGPPTFLEALQRPGLDPNTDPQRNVGANILKILATAAAGAPGGKPGILSNLFTAAISPQSVPAAFNTANAADFGSNLLTSQFNRIPGGAFLKDKFPKLTSSLLSAISGGANAAGTAAERGGNASSAGTVGAGVGGALGFGGGLAHGMMQKLPSPAASRIDERLAQMSNPPANPVDQLRNVESLFGVLSGAPKQQEAFADATGNVGLQRSLFDVFNRQATKSRPTVKGAATAAAEAKARFQNAGRLTEIGQMSDIDAAKDYLRLDFRNELFPIQKSIADLEEKYPSAATKNLPWYKQRLQQLRDEEAAVLTKAEQARNLTRRTEAAATRAETSTINAEASGSPMAKLMRDAQMTEQRQRKRLSGLEGAQNAAEVGALKAQTEAAVADNRLQEIFNAAKINPTDIPERGQLFLSKLSPKQKSLTLRQTVDTAMSDESYAEGLREILQARDPEMLRAVKADYLYQIFQPYKSGKGGRGGFADPYEGSKLMSRLEQLNPMAVNALFDNPKAYHDLKELAAAAAQGEHLVRERKIGAPVGALVTTGLAGTAMNMMGRNVTDPATMATLATAAGTGYLVMNIPRFIEANIESDGALGRMLTTYIKSKNPEKLPAAISAAVARVATAKRYPTPSSTKSKLPEVEVYR